MIASRPLARLLAAACLAAGLNACSTIRDLNPFDGGDDAPTARATEGRRIPVVALDQELKPADALRGATFQLPPAVINTAWPQPGGSPENALDHVQAAPALAIAWRRDVGEGAARGRQVTASPVAAGGRVFTMDALATVSAHDGASGAPIWRVNLAPRDRRDSEAFGGGLAVVDGRLYVTSGFRFVAALDARNGAVIWRTRVEAPVHGAPTVADGRIFAVNTDDEILAFDARTGVQSWSYQALVEPARFSIASSPAVSGEVVVAPFASGELVALRAQNGNELWTEVLARASRTNALSEIRDIAGRPVIYRGGVYAASHSGVFAATDLRTGGRIWSLPISAITTPRPTGDVVFVMSRAGELVCANRETGQVYWVSDLNRGRTRKEGGLLGIGDREVRPTWSGPLLASNRLILVSTDGLAVAVDPRTGAVTRTLNLGSPAFLSPIAANGVIYVVTDEAQLIAIR